MDRPQSLSCRAPDSRRGVSLPELLVVISILALGVMVSIPRIADSIQRAKVRSAASQYAVTLRAARMIAVSKQRPIGVAQCPHADHGGCLCTARPGYEYEDSAGRVRATELPDGVWIDPASSGAVVFGRDGGLADAATTVIACKMSGGRTDVWTVDVPVTGIPQVRHEIDWEESGSP